MSGREMTKGALWRGLRGPSGPAIQGLVRQARRQGWRVRLSAGNHVRLYPPRGGRPVSAPLTSSGPRSWRKVRAELRRQGLNVR